MYLFQNGDKFEGTINKETTEGIGEFYYSQSGIIYKGAFKNSLFHGEGELNFNNQTYTGYWLDGKPITNKEWQIRTQNYIYKGYVDEQLRKNNFGEIIYNNQDKYSGDWKQDTYCGKGILTTSDFEYQGHFFNNKFHGQGTLKHKDFLYIGNFELGMMSGKGILESENLSYEGSFLNNQRHGQGILKCQNNLQKYEGQWFEDELQGQATLYQQDQHFGEIKYFGEFYKGLPEGKGELFIGNVDRYLGEFREGKFHGQGSYFTNNSTVVKGQFYNNYADGDICVTFQNNQLMKCYFTKNKKNGLCQMRIQDLEYEGFFNNNIEDLDSKSFKTVAK